MAEIPFPYEPDPFGWKKPYSEMKLKRFTRKEIRAIRAVLRALAGA